MSVFEKVCRKLHGRTGFVYLMFVGRETHTAAIKKGLLEHVYRNKESIYQAVERLVKDDGRYLQFLGEQQVREGPGRASHIYTASFEPVFCVLRAKDVAFQREQLESLLRSLSFLNDDFPAYYVKTPIFPLGEANWAVTLSTYLRYLGLSLVNAEQRRRDTSLRKPSREVIEKHPFLEYAYKFFPMYQPYLEREMYRNELRDVFARYPGGWRVLVDTAMSLMFKSVGGEFEPVLSGMMNIILEQFELRYNLKLARN